jgi:hypothetical protein
MHGPMNIKRDKCFALTLIETMDRPARSLVTVLITVHGFGDRCTKYVYGALVYW